MMDEIVALLRGRPARRVSYHRIGPERVRDDRLAKDEFEVGASYFELRLAEMRIADARVLFRTFLPLCAVLVEYLYDGSRRTAPVIVDNDLIREVLEQASTGDGQFDLVNTHLLGPVPLMEDRLGLFVGLFRAQHNDYASMLLDVLADLGELTGLSQAESAARTGYGALRRLMGCESVEPLLGRRSEFRLSGGAAEPLRSTYLVYLNDEDARVPGDELWVVDGTLHRGRAPESAEPLADMDYCLVSLEARRGRGHFTDLPFHAEWGELKRLVGSGDVELAEKYAWLRLIRSIKSCPDLTPADQSAALAAYRLMLEREVEDYERAMAPLTRRGAVRSARPAGRHVGQAALLEGARRARGVNGAAHDPLLALAKFYGDCGERELAGCADDGNEAAWVDSLVATMRERVVPDVSSPEVLHDAFVTEVYGTP